jgi:prepilin-type N-terminal cleavage/methylation domain-containing protein
MGSRTGFTLVELLIVVVILGLLAGVVVPQFTIATNEARAGNLRSQLRSLQHQCDLWRSRNHFAHPVTAAAQSWAVLVDQGYIKAPPSNPAWPGPVSTATTVWAASVAGVHGDGAWAWVWNAPDATVYASYFNEAAVQITATAQ